MKEVPITCPLIDEIINTLTFKTATYHKDGVFYQSFNCDTIKEVIDILEQIRAMNKQLRYNAHYWERLYEATHYVEYEFNPEVLPK